MIKKVNAIDTSALVKKTDYDAKINENKGDIPSIAGLDTPAVLNVVNNKLPNVSSITTTTTTATTTTTTTKTDYDAKISDIESKYFTTLIIIKFTKNILDAKIKKKVFNESNIPGFIKNIDLDEKIKKK